MQRPKIDHAVNAAKRERDRIVIEFPSERWTAITVIVETDHVSKIVTPPYSGVIAEDRKRSCPYVYFFLIFPEVVIQNVTKFRHFPDSLELKKRTINHKLLFDFLQFRGLGQPSWGGPSSLRAKLAIDVRRISIHKNL
jgi:hypothetical protein